MVAAAGAPRLPSSPEEGGAAGQEATGKGSPEAPAFTWHWKNLRVLLRKEERSQVLLWQRVALANMQICFSETKRRKRAGILEF